MNEALRLKLLSDEHLAFTIGRLERTIAGLRAVQSDPGPRIVQSFQERLDLARAELERRAT